MDCKFSIITATFNSDETIKETLKSVVFQENIDVEYIIIDGESTDKTLEIINKIDESIIVISEKDNGIYDALNKGIKNSHGDVIGFLHSDDLFASNDILEKICLSFEKTCADVVYGDLEYVDKSNTNKIIRKWKSRTFKKELLKRGWMPAHPTVFIKREVYQKHGLFDLNFKIAADYDLMLRIFSDSSLNFAYLPEVVTKMRVGGESNKSLKNIIIKSQEDYKVLRKNNIKNPLCALFLKNVSKIPQFFNR